MRFYDVTKKDLKKMKKQNVSQGEGQSKSVSVLKEGVLKV